MDNRLQRAEDGHQAYLENARTELQRLDGQIALLQAKAEQAAAEAGIGYDDVLQDLRRQREDLFARVQQLGAASGDVWGELRTGLDRASESMRDALKKARERFR